MFKKRAQLSTENRALLALAMAESGGPAEMIAELLDPKQEVRQPDDDWFWSASRETAMRLMAWSRHDPKSPVVAKPARDRTDGDAATAGIGSPRRAIAGRCSRSPIIFTTRKRPTRK